jgi:molybdopterin molybdotransferase
MSFVPLSSDLLSYDAAAALVRAGAGKLLDASRRVERVALRHSAGRVLARPLIADRDQPPFARSTRDGYACRARDANAHGFLPIAGGSRAGDAPAGPLPERAAWEIMTGAPVPAGADAVMMLEHVEAAGRPAAQTVRLLPPRTLAAGENVVDRGCQAHSGDELLPAGSLVQAAQMALAASCGYGELEVFTRPRVAILATGDELVPIEADPGPGQIRNSNSPMLAALVEQSGGGPLVLPVAADTDMALDAALERAAEADLLLVTGGVSAGSYDLVEPALLRMGARFHFTGVRIQPGKPAVFGEIARSPAPGDKNGILCCLGLPGNPVSSAVTFLLFAAPLVRALAGRSEFEPRFALARLAGAVTGKPGLTRFLPATCTFGAGGGLPEVQLVPWQGSGDLTALGRSNCFLVLDEPSERVGAGATVRILLS